MKQSVTTTIYILALIASLVWVNVIVLSEDPNLLVRVVFNVAVIFCFWIVKRIFKYLVN
jgi:hypothetical protein